MQEQIQNLSKSHFGQLHVDHYDVVIIGAGAMGTATAYYLSKSNKKVLLLEQFEFLHKNGSSHGESRIIRRAYPEKHFANLMADTYNLWHEIENENGSKIIHTTGGLDFGNKDNEELNSVEKACQMVGINYEKLGASELRNRFPILDIPDDYMGIYQPDAGIINADASLTILQDQSRKNGATLIDNTKVVNITNNDSKIIIETTKGSFIANKLIISAGAWINTILNLIDNPIQVDVDIWKLTLAYWEVRNNELYTPPNFPIFINWGQDHYYGFPIFEKPGHIKIGPHFKVEAIENMENKTTQPNPEIVALLEKYVKSRFKEIDSTAKDSLSCMYTMTADENFIIDFHPNHSNILIAAGFSGHGFKFTPLIGKMLTQMVIDGETEFDRSYFDVKSKLKDI